MRGKSCVTCDKASPLISIWYQTRSSFAEMAGVRDTEVDEQGAPIRAATVRERLPQRAQRPRACNRSLTVAALPDVLLR